MGGVAVPSCVVCLSIAALVVVMRGGHPGGDVTGEARGRTAGKREALTTAILRDALARCNPADSVTVAEVALLVEILTARTSVLTRIAEASQCCKQKKTSTRNLHNHIL